MANDAPVGLYDTIPPPPLDGPAVVVDAVERVIRAALGPVVERLRTVEAVSGGLGPIVERIATLEATAPVPGPPGPIGAPGLGFDDVTVEHDGERRITIAFRRGDERKETAIVVPAMLYRGVFDAGKQYERGDCVTFDGAIWHANAATTARPGDGSQVWTLAVKRGRDRYIRDGAR